jgi:hypothetical protein
MRHLTFEPSGVRPRCPGGMLAYHSCIDCGFCPGTAASAPYSRRKATAPSASTVGARKRSVLTRAPSANHALCSEPPSA